jgi:hypothetical protein
MINHTFCGTHPLLSDISRTSKPLKVKLRKDEELSRELPQQQTNSFCPFIWVRRSRWASNSVAKRGWGLYGNDACGTGCQFRVENDMRKSRLWISIMHFLLLFAIRQVRGEGKMVWPGIPPLDSSAQLVACRKSPDAANPMLQACSRVNQMRPEASESLLAAPSIRAALCRSGRRKSLRTSYANGRRREETCRSLSLCVGLLRGTLAVGCSHGLAADGRRGKRCVDRSVHVLCRVVTGSRLVGMAFRFR